jgi:hypothetical protein
MAEMKEDTLPVESLLLDPNNYRFQDEGDFVTADSSRLHEENVQDRAYRRLRRSGLQELKNSILANGFLPVERLVVRSYEAKSGSFLVLEGNRRLAALRWIAEDHAAGVGVPDEVLKSMDAVPVVVVSGEGDDSVYLAIMGIRHVGGIREWGGYQRAKLVTELRDAYSLDGPEIGGRLGMSTQEVNRRYRAFKALAQMQDDDEYGDRAAPTMYALFHEAVALPTVRSWLEWNESNWRFENEEELHQFYELIAPSERDEGPTPEPKISGYSQVRQLRSILSHQDAKRILTDPDRTYHDALAIAKAEELSRTWITQVAEASAALSSIGWKDLANMSNSDIEEVKGLLATANELLASYEKLTSPS